MYEYNSLQWLGGDSYVCAPTKLDEASIAVLIDNVLNVDSDFVILVMGCNLLVWLSFGICIARYM